MLPSVDAPNNTIIFHHNTIDYISTSWAAFVSSITSIADASVLQNSTTLDCSQLENMSSTHCLHDHVHSPSAGSVLVNNIIGFDDYAHLTSFPGEYTDTPPPVRDKHLRLMAVRHDSPSFKYAHNRGKTIMVASINRSIKL